MSWRNIAGLAGATSKDKYRLQWHALCPLLGREHCAIRSRAKFTSTAYEIIVNSSVPVSSRLLSARSCISTSSVTSFSLVRISATGYLLSSLSYLVSRYTAEAHRTGRIKGLTCRRVATFFSSLPPGKSRRIYNINAHRSWSCSSPLFKLFTY